MGVLESLLGPKGGAYKHPLVELEGVVGAWTAARTSGGLSLSGGQVVLAQNVLVFSPWDMDKTRAFLTKTLGKAGVPHLGTVDKALDTTGLLEPVVVSVSEIAGAQPLNGASLLNPPQVRISLRDGRTLDLGVLHSPTTPNFSGRNNAARDDLVAKLSAAIG